LKSFTPGILVSYRAIFGILATWKIWFFNYNESLESKVSCFRCITNSHFDGLKILFLNFPETLCSRFRGYRWSHILHFGGLKMRFLAGLDTISPRVLDFLSKPFLCVLVAWKCVSVRVISFRPAIFQPGLWTSRHYREEESREVVETSRWRNVAKRKPQKSF
jgi:hypothetical protein